MNNITEIYTSIYDEMKERNKSNILVQGTKFDPLLSSREKDKRVGFALFTDTSFALNTVYDQMLAEAQQTFSPHIIYKPTLNPQINHGLLHFTFIQFIGVDPLIKTLTTEHTKEYIKLLTPLLSSIPSFSIQYKGLIALATGLVMIGYPSIDINKIRKEIRKEIINSKLPFKEPYKTDIAHSTFIRFSQKENPQKLLSFAKKYQNVDLGSVDVTGFYLGNGSWKMLPSEITKIHEFSLQ